MAGLFSLKFKQRIEAQKDELAEQERRIQELVIRIRGANRGGGERYATCSGAHRKPKIAGGAGMSAGYYGIVNEFRVQVNGPVADEIGALTEPLKSTVIEALKALTLQRLKVPGSDKEFFVAKPTPRTRFLLRREEDHLLVVGFFERPVEAEVLDTAASFEEVITGQRDTSPVVAAAAYKLLEDLASKAS